MTVLSTPAFYSCIYFIASFQIAMVSDPLTSSFYDRVSSSTRIGLVFTFPDLPMQADGFNVVVNDVLRFGGLKTYNGQDVADFAWHRRFAYEIECFRFGYVHTRALGAVWYGDSTEPALWAVNGSFFGLPSQSMEIGC